MAESSSSAATTHVHTRSISLPTRLIHPKAQRVEEELKKIQALNSSSSASSRIQLGLARLVELYDFVNDQVICSPQGQQALRLSHNGKLVEEALDESIFLLDVSDFTRDLIGTFMEQIQELQSTLRRRGGDLSIIQPEIRAYISFQKKFKNAATRQLKSLARTQKKKPLVIKQSDSLDQHSSMVSNILRRSNTSTISIFQSLLQFLSSLGENRKKNGEIGCVDNSMIRSFYGRIIGKKIAKVTNVQTMLGILAMLNVSLEAIKDELSYLSRRLIQQRASLLNIVTP
ncbi:hypothetical protein EUTSA_v10027454mg [Eutrema salsugineum]|uniref:Uncharacterized protein n=1 Tax=Eutrema salsugineum TaxID=72664 RepID=V4MAZ8_EUTSA|nr:uncharacterized protein LOC18028264 [Eutrema salsugineum]ESQ53529.1 hypothetical protein EUTSA_v10027454mg [Eutrema salsugineum]